jgi:Protein of unknown function (DUF2934)/Anti-sigma factor NepR
MPPKPPGRGSEVMGVPDADPIDLWLRGSLRRLYAAVAAEPIPPELMQLLARLEGAEPTSQEPAADQPPEEDISASDDGFEQRVRERAYFLWLEEGCPEGRALEHWMLAFTQQVAQEPSGLRRPGSEKAPRSSAGVLGR